MYCLLDKDVELVWEQLSVEEREEFQKMISDGRIGHLLDSYTPWWKVSKSLISRLDSINDSHNNIVYLCVFGLLWCIPQWK